jgi:spermidine synthase
MLPFLRHARLALIGLAFFLSGAAALSYQVAWQRLLAFQTGVGLYSIAVIVAAFMVGLGMGSHLGGWASTQVSARRALVWFAGCELAIAAYGALSGRLYYDWLYLRFGWLYASPLRGGLLHLASLAVPTVLMGMSLPFLTRAMVRDAESASGTISFLYGTNVVGAAAGALATPWVFIRHHGILAPVLAAVAANVIAGTSALVLAMIESGVPAETETASAAATAVRTGRGTGGTDRLRGWMALYALSGFCALALEMLWFRLMELAVKSTAYTFGTLLAVYLLGSGAGSLAGIAIAPRLGAPRRTFLACQCLLLAYAGAVLALLVWLPPDTPGYAWYYELWGGYRSFNLGGPRHTAALLRLYVVFPIVLFGPPTVLMGLSYPILQRAVQDDPALSGRKVGLLQAANIAGCVAGSLLVGLGTLTWLGTPGTLRLLVIVGIVFALLGLREPGPRRSFLALALLLAAVAAAVPGQRALWLRLHGTADRASLLEEDATGVVALIPARDRWKVWAGGRNHSMLPFGGIHTTLGAAPAIVHPAPREVAIIGLGSGDTAASAGCRRDVDQHVTVFELYAPEHRQLLALLDLPDPPAKLGRLLGDPRYTFRIADGRNALERDGRLYDLIEADALWPTTPYAGNLYSLDFFRMCARRLRPGGLVTTWVPSRRVRATFLATFPHAIDVGADVVIGSQSPIEIDPDAWQRRVFAPSTVAYLGGPRSNAVWAELQSARPAAQAPPGTAINRDLFPRDEFNTPD